MTDFCPRNSLKQLFSLSHFSTLSTKTQFIFWELHVFALRMINIIYPIIQDISGVSTSTLDRPFCHLEWNFVSEFVHRIVISGIIKSIIPEIAIGCNKVLDYIKDFNLLKSVQIGTYSPR